VARLAEIRALDENPQRTRCVGPVRCRPTAARGNEDLEWAQHFIIASPRSNEAMFIGETAGTQAKGVLPTEFECQATTNAKTEETPRAGHGRWDLDLRIRLGLSGIIAATLAKRYRA